jgi:phosphoglucosamine mutase
VEAGTQAFRVDSWSLGAFCVARRKISFSLFVLVSDQKLFGTDGVRGTANTDPITVPSVLRLIRAAVEVLSLTETRPKVLVGRDTRASGEMLESAVAAGLTSNGADVVLAGTLPTPAIAYVTAAQGASFGVVISASHNPFEDNGIKFFGSDGYKLSDELEQAIESAYFNSSDNLRDTAAKNIGRVHHLRDAVEQYASLATSSFPKSSSLKGLKIAVDTANGAAFQTTPLVLSSLGANLELRCAAPDGFNINAGCGSTHPEFISRVVLETGASVGIAHDGDADRVVFCDEKGEALDGDELLAIAAIDYLRRDRLRDKTLVATVMSNFGLDELLRSHGGRVLRTAVGDRHVVDAMIKSHLNVGGEQSGHLIFRDFATTGDGLISALQILSIMVSTGKPLSELRLLLQKFPQVQRNIRVRSKPPIAQIPGVTERIAAAEKDLAEKGRVLVRYSGTEPLIRVLLEGPDRTQLENLADGIAKTIEDHLSP